MEIVIAAGGIPFGPNTLKHRSLGGSETAALLVAKELAKLDHFVTVFCPLPKEGPDAWQSGMLCDDKVRWCDLQELENYIVNTECDLYVASRDPRMLNLPHQAKKAVLWAHDLATFSQMQPMVHGTAWNFQEIWCVSEFHRQQFHKVTGYPLERIRATRNGIVPHETLPTPKVPRQLLFASRPERGLEHLVKPNGIMSKLPEFNLKVCFYDNFPPHLHDYYRQLFAWASELPNVEVLGPRRQNELRQIIRDSWAYVYPSDFEETSCILARECAEQQTPMVYFEVGALPESATGIGLDAVLAPKLFQDNQESYELFARTVRHLDETPERYETLQAMCRDRDDLYWAGVAEQWLSWLPDRSKNINLFTRLHSLVEVSDVVPALALINFVKDSGYRLDEWTSHYIDELRSFYPFLTGLKTLKQHYDDYYEQVEKPKTGLKAHDLRNTGRFKDLLEALKTLPPGSTVLDYACGEGSIVIGMAQELPHINFWGCDIAKDEIEALQRNSKDLNLPNLKGFFVGSTDEWPAELEGLEFDAAMANEVLEHVEKPWELIQFVESKVKLGGKVCLTVPNGPWEMIGLRRDPTLWRWRAHIWHLDKAKIREMFADKEETAMKKATNGHTDAGEAIGNTTFTYRADHQPVRALNPLGCALAHADRQTIGAAMIALNNEESILQALNTLSPNVDALQVALGPSTDATRDIIQTWAANNPWTQVRILEVPQIKAREFGFDDARNASTAGLPTDWIFWLDTDEYLIGQTLRRFAKDNGLDSYAIRQHHFTVEPAGAPAQVDKPARLYKNFSEFKFYGKVHEHAEKGFNGGPGYCMELPRTDIGHGGYKNEQVRINRFQRNFPLLEWDREVFPTRRLGYFLWLRDLVHRMRFHHMQGDLRGAKKLAEETVQFYNENWESLKTFGNGTMLAFSYYSEALQYLGKGLPVQVEIKVSMDDGQHWNPVGFGGAVDDPEQITRLIADALKAPLEQKSSKYFG